MENFTYCFNPEDNGGESLTLSIKYELIGNPTETLTLNSYGSMASITTYGFFTSEKLFDLAQKVLELETRIKNS